MRVNVIKSGSNTALIFMPSGLKQLINIYQITNIL